MNYRKDKYGNDVSILGFGCMRFSSTMGKIDVKKAEQEIMAAYRAGVNHFDTAYIYPGSEALLGEVLERNGIRDKVRIATKLPHYLIKSREGIEKVFREELARLRTDYVDVYLMHMLTDVQTWEKLKDLGIVEWLEEKKRSGEIRQVGFSYHGNSDMFCQMVDAYDWDMCLIQYNYLDEHSQAGRKGLHYAHAKGLPVFIMEPLRGGKLVSHLPEAAKRVMAEHDVQHTPAQWAFRWLWDQKEVTCVLSGMNSLEMVEDNCATASSAQPGELTAGDQAMLAKVVEAIRSAMKVGCTGCGYCMPCPKNVDIPGTFAAYNHCFTEGKSSAMWEYVKCTALRRTSTAASNCVSCGKCEQHCPQHIAIRDELKNASRALETPFYRLIRRVIRLFRAY
ncbi:MAG: aldo/keto reductase [Clostridia bacterium]|nr:aldo/keto reductase [Clostridia bacterium]